MDSSDPAQVLARARLTAERTLHQEFMRWIGSNRHLFHDPQAAESFSEDEYAPTHIDQHMLAAEVAKDDYIHKVLPMEQYAQDREVNNIVRMQEARKAGFVKRAILGITKKDGVPIDEYTRVAMLMAEDHEHREMIWQREQKLLEKVHAEQVKNQYKSLAQRYDELQKATTSDEYWQLIGKWGKSELGLTGQETVPELQSMVREMRTAFHTAEQNALRERFTASPVQIIKKVQVPKTIGMEAPTHLLRAAGNQETLTSMLAERDDLLSRFHVTHTHALDWSNQVSSAVKGKKGARELRKIRGALIQAHDVLNNVRQGYDPFAGDGAVQEYYARLHNAGAEYLDRLNQYRMRSQSVLSRLGIHADAPSMLFTHELATRIELSIFRGALLGASEMSSTDGLIRHGEALLDATKSSTSTEYLSRSFAIYGAKKPVTVDMLRWDRRFTDQLSDIFRHQDEDVAQEMLVGVAEISGNLFYDTLTSIKTVNGKPVLPGVGLATKEAVISRVIDILKSKHASIRDRALSVHSASAGGGLTGIGLTAPVSAKDIVSQYDQIFPVKMQRTPMTFSPEEASYLLGLVSGYGDSLPGHVMERMASQGMIHYSEHASPLGAKAHVGGVWSALEQQSGLSGMSLMTRLRTLLTESVTDPSQASLHAGLAARILHDPDVLYTARESIGTRVFYGDELQDDIESSQASTLNYTPSIADSDTNLTKMSEYASRSFPEMPRVDANAVHILSDKAYPLTLDNESLNYMHDLGLLTNNLGMTATARGASVDPIHGRLAGDARVHGAVYPIVETPQGRVLTSPDGYFYGTEEEIAKYVTRQTRQAMSPTASAQDLARSGRIRVRGGRFVAPDLRGRIYGDVDLQRLQSLKDGDKLVSLDIETAGAERTPYMIDYTKGVYGQPTSAAAHSAEYVRISEDTATTMRRTVAGMQDDPRAYKLLQQGLKPLMDRQGFTDIHQAIDHLASGNVRTVDEVMKEVRAAVKDADYVVGFNLRQFDLPILAKHSKGIQRDAQVIDVMAALQAGGAGTLSQQRLMDKAEGHAGEDSLDLLGALGNAKSMPVVSGGDVEDPRYVVRRADGRIFKVAAPVKGMTDTGEAQYTLSMEHAVSSIDRRSGVKQGEDWSFTGSQAFMENELQRSFVPATTMKEAEQLQSWKIADFSGRRVRRFQARYLAQDKMILERLAPVLESGGDVVESMRSWQSQLGTMDELISQMNSAASANEKTAYQAIIHNLTGVRVTGSNDASVLIRARKLYERAEDLISSMSGMDNNTRRAQFEHLRKGIFNPENAPGQALLGVAESVDAAIDRGQLDVRGGNRIMAAVWEDLHRNKLIQSTVVEGAERNALEMRETLHLTGVQGVDVMQTFDFTHETTLDANVTSAVDKARELIKKTTGTLHERIPVQEGVEKELRRQLKIDPETELLTGMRQAFLEKTMKYDQMDTIGASDPGKAVALLNQLRDDIDTDPIAVAERVTMSSRKFTGEDAPVALHISKLDEEIDTRWREEQEAEQKAYEQDHAERMREQTAQAPPVTALPPLPGGLVENIPLLSNVAPLNIENDMATQIGMALDKAPEWLGKYGFLAGAAGILAFGALGLSAPRLQPPSSEQDDYHAQRTLLPMRRHMLAPPEPIPAGGQEPQHFSVTVRGVTGDRGDQGHLAEIVRRVLSSHAGVDYTPDVHHHDRRAQIDRTWVSQMQRRVY